MFLSACIDIIYIYNLKKTDLKTSRDYKCRHIEIKHIYKLKESEHRNPFYIHLKTSDDYKRRFLDF